MFSGFSGAKLRFFWRTTKLLQDFLLKIVEMGLAGGAVAEESDTDALPIAAPHGEGVACLHEMLAVKAVGELMAVLLTVVGDAQPEPVKLPAAHNLPLTTRLHEDALRTEADAAEQLAAAEEPSTAVA